MIYAHADMLYAGLLPDPEKTAADEGVGLDGCADAILRNQRS